MSNKDYLECLLLLCTEKQKVLFNRMYPDGINTNSKKSWAIRQLENTLKNLNSSKEELRESKEENEKISIQAINDINLVKQELVQTKKELEESRSEASKLSNPINTNNLDIQNRLELLDALEAGGVDNWEFYEDSIESYSK